MKKTGPGKPVRIFEVWKIEVRPYCSFPLFYNITHTFKGCALRKIEGDPVL